MRSLVIVFLLFSLLGCASRGVVTNEISGSYNENVKKLDLDRSFGFYNGKDEFYFSQILIRNKEFKCEYFVGFKNGQFKYSFPLYRLSELSKIYYKKGTLKAKKASIIKKINQFEVVNQKCTEEIAIRNKKTSEQIADAFRILIYLPAASLGIFFGAEYIISSLQDHFLLDKMDDIRLGMKKEQIEGLLGKKLIQQKLKYYNYYTIDSEHSRMAMTFERGYLKGFVRGFKTTTKHEK